MQDKRKEYLALSRQKVSQTLKAIRKEFDISRADMAKKLGVSKAVIDRAEQGITRADIAMVMAYCDVLGCLADVEIINKHSYVVFYADNYNTPNSND